MGHVCKGGVCCPLLGWAFAQGFGAHCQSLLGAAAVWDLLAVETLALFFKAFCGHQPHAVRGEHAPTGTVPCSEWRQGAASHAVGLGHSERVRGAGF